MLFHAPGLFSLLYSDIVHCVDESDVVLFADDTAIVTADKNIFDTSDKVNARLNAVNRFLVENGMEPNRKKTEYIVFRSVPPVTEIVVEKSRPHPSRMLQVSGCDN